MSSLSRDALAAYQAVIDLALLTPGEAASIDSDGYMRHLEAVNECPKIAKRLLDHVRMVDRRLSYKGLPGRSGRKLDDNGFLEQSTPFFPSGDEL